MRRGKPTFEPLNPSALEPYLQIQRTGTLFFCRTSTDGVNWQELPCSPVTREDLQDLSLQVGLYTTSVPDSYIAFDAFSIRESISIPFKAYSPSPSVGAENIGSTILSWQPGQTALYHQVWIGNSPEDLMMVISPPRPVPGNPANIAIMKLLIRK